MIRRRFRDALSGRFTTKAEADLAPGSHVAEARPVTGERVFHAALVTAVDDFLHAWDGHGSGERLANAVQSLRDARELQR